MSVDWGSVFSTGIGIINSQIEKGKAKKTGPVAVIEKANDYTAVNNSMPPWLIPVAVVGVLLMFGKKIFK